MELLPIGILRPFSRGREIINAGALSPTGDLLALASEEGELAVYNQHLHRLGYVEDITDGHGFPWVTVLAGGHVIGGRSGEVDVAARFQPDGQRIGTLRFPGAPWDGRGLPDGRLLMMFLHTGDQDEGPSRLALHDPETGAELGVVARHEREVCCHAVALRAPRGVSADRGVLMGWGLRPGPPLWTVRTEHPVSELAITPDGRWLVVASAERLLQLRDAGTGALIREGYAPPTRMFSLGMMPDGKHVMMRVDQYLQLWRLPDLGPVRAARHAVGWPVWCYLSLAGDIAAVVGNNDVGLFRLRDGVEPVR